MTFVGVGPGPLGYKFAQLFSVRSGGIRREVQMDPESIASLLEGARSTRRAFLQQLGAAAVAAMAVHGVLPAQARAEGLRHAVLSEAEVKCLEALGDTLLPGAAKEGIAHYVDTQLASSQPLLMLRYLDFPMPLTDFYRQGLAALDALAASRHQKPFCELTAAQRNDLVFALAKSNPAEWQGPPAPLFYFALRADAVDVVYGTMKGFEALGIPYMAHIAPKEVW